MKSLLKVILILALFFASTFIVLKFTGIITVEKIQLWLDAAKSANLAYVMLIVVGLLFADLFIAVPTLTVITIGGYLLGPIYGAIASTVGLFLAGTCGYGVSRYYGHVLFHFLVKDPHKRDEVIALFNSHGPVMLLLSRATPILPEVSACMSGMTKMPFFKFLILWLVNVVPYTIIASYAGSISDWDNPMPAIFTAIGLTLFLWCGWLVFRFMNKSKLSIG
ncbi:VTT domain-containing protein [Pseudoalteromonas sp. MMG013]|uniref:TVP38/TMEM64 family protein n=1 Tax=Pseudoalteromonas sp. MMG013 TaxID=2822687 RepID=UPI001B35F1E3|nr:VTT domain-containing protein [Pseudoalteromonas sp. MMG013]MBQ4862411.1 VTT domain-containing protein [Pseudoalteromonas sp. MMG013]